MPSKLVRWSEGFFGSNTVVFLLGLATGLGGLLALVERWRRKRKETKQGSPPPQSAGQSGEGIPVVNDDLAPGEDETA